MGTWGTSITADDTVSDIVGFIKDQLKNGASIKEATTKAAIKFSELEKNEDEEPLLLVAIAFTQWKYGEVDPSILERVRNDIKNERGLDRWRESPKLLAKRKAVLTEFISKIELPNPKTSKPPKLIIRRAPFKEGDCLSVALPDGRYTAALVLKTDNSNPECGSNLVASLDYLDTLPPDLSVFKRKNWLVLSHGNWNNEKDICWYIPVRFKEVSNRIQVVGNISLGWFLPKSKEMYGSWGHLGEQILLCHAHEANKNA
jgi:hypothetical protein